MSDKTNPPFPPEVDSLLEAERARPGPPPEVTSRMYGRLAATLGLPPGPSGPDGGSAAQGDPGVPPADTSGATTAAAAAGGAVGRLAKPAIAVAFAVGAIAGSVTTHLVHKSTDRQPIARGGKGRSPAARWSGATKDTVTNNQVTHKYTVDTPKAPPVEEPAPPTPPAKRRVVIRATKRPVPESSSPDRQLAPEDDLPLPAGSSLAVEQALVERARSALVRSRPADALAALDQHERRFPDGKLAEEREAIRVLALAADGEHEQARKSAKRFRKRYPRSLLLPAVEGALNGRPRQMADREKPWILK
jgi:hypothetical protein